MDGSPLWRAGLGHWPWKVLGLCHPRVGVEVIPRADRYYVQKAVRALAPELTLNAMRPATPEDYHSAREPSEFEYESEGLEGPGTDSTGYSSMTTTTSYHDTDNTQCSDTKNRDHKRQRQKHQD